MNLSIPAFHVSDGSKVKGRGEIFIASRKDLNSSGVFLVNAALGFDPGTNAYPAGNLTIKADLSDGAKGTFTATTIELINSHGKHNPTVFVTGHCIGEGRELENKGLRYWLMIANNKGAQEREGTPDIVGFAIHDRAGVRVTYGTGPHRKGDFEVLAE